ncbi:MAG: Glucose-phosphate cytidylyltransferase [Fibrobacteres bacterium]|nr:Glucose-phosphate cytidylyltransferase [Fibrobacterota bacterium]
MKVVLFCGGLGMRLREYSENVPKPMVPIGYRPILWHLMKYYASYGHKDFILALGYKSDTIKDYFLHYDECLSNDFVLNGQGKPELLNRDIEDWKITFVDTGTHSNIGQRLRAVRKHLDGEEMFLANYSDGLTDLNLDKMVDYHKRGGQVATFLCVSPGQSFHAVTLEPDGHVSDIHDLSQSGVNINGGFFVFKNQIFDYMRDGEELVHAPFKRLIEIRQLVAYPYKGFWASMDTFKDKQKLDDLHAKGEAPWEIWVRKELEEKVHA